MGSMNHIQQYRREKIPCLDEKLTVCSFHTSQHYRCPRQNINQGLIKLISYLRFHSLGDRNMNTFNRIFLGIPLKIIHFQAQRNLGGPSQISTLPTGEDGSEYLKSLLQRTLSNFICIGSVAIVLHYTFCQDYQIYVTKGNHFDNDMTVLSEIYFSTHAHAKQVSYQSRFRGRAHWQVSVRLIFGIRLS